MNQVNRAVHDLVRGLGDWTVMEHGLYTFAAIAVVYIFVIVARDNSPA